MGRKTYEQTRTEHTQLIKSLYDFMLGSDGFIVKYNHARQINEFDFAYNEKKSGVRIYCHCETDKTGKLTLTIDNKDVFPQSLTCYPEHMITDAITIPVQSVYDYLNTVLKEYQEA